MFFRFSMRWFFILFLLIIDLLFGGCAQTTYQIAKTVETNGIRYFAPGTYLLLTPDAKNGKVKVTQYTLPNTKKLYAVDSYAWMATNDTTIDFDHGMIKKVISEQNSVKVINSSVKALSALAKAALEAATASAKAASGARMSESETKASDKPPVFFYYVNGDQLVQLYPEKTVEKLREKQ